MKKMKHLGKIALFTLALAFTACSSDSEGGSVIAGAGTITAKVDGATVTSIQQATFAYVSDAGLQLSGSNINGQGFLLVVFLYDGVGSYEIGGSSEASASYTAIDMNNPSNTNNVWTAPYSDTAVDGVIEVTEQTATNVKGTFSFKAKNLSGTIKDVTNGSFDVPISALAK